MSKSYTPPDRSTYDPGWNDPPPMPTGPSTASMPSARPRLNLNKRVAFPMQSGSTTSNSCVKTTAEGLPLPFSTAKYQPTQMNATLPESNVQQATALPPPPPLILGEVGNIFTPPAAEENTVAAFEPSAARDFCHMIFIRFADQMDAVKGTEIRKRIESLNEMWIGNKFDETLQQSLYKLAHALDKNDVNLANKQHRLIATHHINISTQWATALRQIINSISFGEPTELNDDHEPTLLPNDEINAVQFMNISSKPIVLDPIPSYLPQTLNNPISLPVEQLTTAEINQNNETHANELNSSKSKSGRFGPILHL